MSSKSYVLHIENFLKVEKATIPLTPGVHGLVGKNAQGKTTFIHALHDLMSGKNDFTKIRDGAEKAMVRIDVMENGELVQTVQRTQTKETMKLEGKGMRPGQTAIGLLASLMDEVAINPVTLATTNPVEYLKQHLKVQIEKTDIPEEMQALVNETQIFGGEQTTVKGSGFQVCEILASDISARRLATGKQVEQETAMVNDIKKGLPAEQPGLPFNDQELTAEKVSLLEKIQGAAVANVNHANAQKLLDSLQQQIKDAEAGVKNLETERANLIAQTDRIAAKIEAMQKQVDVARKVNVAEAEANLAKFPRVDATELEGKVKDIDSKLEHVSVVKKIQQGFKGLFEREAKLKALVEAYRKQDLVAKFFRYELPKILIAKCKLPVEGIEFKDGIMMVGGRTLDKLSTAERALVTTKLAMAIAKQRNQIAICLDGVEYLDDEHRAEFLKAAEESGMCIIYTRLSTTGPAYPHEKEVVAGAILN